MKKRVIKKVAAEAMIEALAGMFLVVGVLGLFLAGKGSHLWITIPLWFALGGLLCIWMERRGF